MLNKKTIEQAIASPNIAIHIFESLPSTNDFLKSLPLEDKIDICLAEEQTQGRGRFDRRWHSPFGQNIYFSCRTVFEKNLSELAGLGLLISVVVVKTLQAFDLPQALYVKWPNDVLYDHKKLSGNLIETSIRSDGKCSVIIGIGINVNMLPENPAWTSLRAILHHDVDRNAVCISLMHHLFDALHQFEKTGMKSFLETWKKVDYLYDKKIRLQCGEKTLQGIGQGIDEKGQLILKLNEGETRAFSSGDTTVRCHPERSEGSSI